MFKAIGRTKRPTHPGKAKLQLPMEACFGGDAVPMDQQSRRRFSAVTHVQDAKSDHCVMPAGISCIYQYLQCNAHAVTKLELVS